MDAIYLKSATNYRLTCYNIITYTLITCTFLICLFSNLSNAQENIATNNRVSQDNTPIASQEDSNRFNLTDDNREPTQDDCDSYCHMKCSTIRNSVNYSFCVKAQSKCSCGINPTYIYSILTFVVIALISVGIHYCKRLRAAHYSRNIQVSTATSSAGTAVPYPAASGFVPMNYSQPAATQGAYTYTPTAAPAPYYPYGSQTSAPFLLTATAESKEPDRPPTYSGISGPK